MNTYKIIYKKYGMLYHEKVRAKSIDDVSMNLRIAEGKDALLVMVRKERKQ